MSEAENNSSSSTSNVGGTASPSNVAPPPSDARRPSSPSLALSPSRPSAPSGMMISIRFPSPEAQRSVILRAVENIFDRGGIFRFLSSTLMYQEPSSVHIFSTEDLGFLVEHRTVWVPVFQNRKKIKNNPSDSRQCNYAAFSVILWNILQESKRFLEEKVRATPHPDPLLLLPLPHASSGVASPATVLADTGRHEEGGGTRPADPPAKTVEWLSSWSSSSSCSWFDQEERWRSASERELFFHCLRRTTYAATLLATLLSMAVGAEVRAMVRVGAEDVRLTIHLLEPLNRLFLDLSGFLEGHPPPPSGTNAAATAYASTTTTTSSSFSSFSPSLTVFDGPFSHHPPSRPYDALTHRLFLAAEESFLQVQLLLVELPRGGATLLDEADVTPILQMMYRTEMWEASGVSLRSTQGYLAALKALFLSTASSPSLSHTTGVAESEGKMMSQLVLQRPSYRHHSFRYSFLRAHREHERRPQKTSSSTDARATTPSALHPVVGEEEQQKKVEGNAVAAAPSSSSARSSDDPPSSTSPVLLPRPDFTRSSSSSAFGTESPQQVSDAGLYYPGGRCGGVLEPSFGLLQLFWAVKEGLEAILCPSATTPVLAMAPIPSHAAAPAAATSPTAPALSSSASVRAAEAHSPPIPRVGLQDMERKGLQQVSHNTRLAFDLDVEHHRRDGARLSFYQLLGYALFYSMPTVDVVPWAPLWERAWGTHLLAASSLPCTPPMEDVPLRPTAAPASFSSSENEKGNAAMSSDTQGNGVVGHTGGGGEGTRPPVWMGNAVLQSYYTPVLRLLLATCYTVKRGDGTTRAAGGRKKGLLSFLSVSSSSSAGREDDDEDDDEDEEEGWHAWVSPDSMLAVWDAIGKCIFQEGAGRYVVGNVPIPVPPALPPLPSSSHPRGRREGGTVPTTGRPTTTATAAVPPLLPASLWCCHLYAPFTMDDVRPVVRVCRWLFRHPLFHVLPPLALSPSFSSSFIPHGGSEGPALFSLSDTTPEEEAEVARKSDDPQTTTIAMPQGRDEDERVSKAFAVVHAMEARVRFIVQVWYHAGEEVQQEVWRETAPSRMPLEKKKDERRGKNPPPSPSSSPSTLASSSSSDTPPSAAMSSPLQAPLPPPPLLFPSGAAASGGGGMGQGKPNRRPHCLTRVAIPRLCAWIEMLTAVLNALLANGIRRAVFPSVLLPSLLDSLTRVFALYTVYIVKGRESVGVLYARGGVEEEEEVYFPSLPSSRAMASQVAALWALLCAMPALLPSSAVNALIEKALVPLVQQVAEDGVWYGVGKEGKRRRDAHLRASHRRFWLEMASETEKEPHRTRSSTEGSADAASPEERSGRNGKGGVDQAAVGPKDALFYARFEGYLRALGTPVSAFAVSDVVFLTYWTDIALTGCLAIPTPRIPSSSFSAAGPFLQSLWTTALDFFLAAFYSKRPLCPLLLPSLLRLMMPSTRPTDTSSSSSSSSLFSFHYPEPPLPLLTYFCRQIRGVCESVVECDGVWLERLLKTTHSIPYQLAKKAYAWHAAAAAAEEGGGRQQVVGMDATPAWTSPFFFPSASLYSTTPTAVVVVKEGVASPSLSSTAPSVQTETTAAGGGGERSAAVRPSPAWEEVLCKVTPCSAVLLVVSSVFDQLCVLANALLHRVANVSSVTQYSFFFSALCSLLMVRHTEVLPRVCASLEALLTEHLRSRASLVTESLHFIESVVTNNTGPLKAPLVQWYLHLVHQLGGVKSRSKM